MKKAVSLVLIFLLTAALLTGCSLPPFLGGPSQSGDAPEASDAAPAENAPATDAAAPADYAESAEPEAEDPADNPEPVEEPEPTDCVVTGRRFSLSLPLDWADQVTVEESVSDDPYRFTVYHSPSFDADGAGLLFSLSLYPDTSFVSLPNYRVVGLLADERQTQYLVMHTPSDVQAGPDFFDEYFALYDEDLFLRICQNLQPAEGYHFQEVDPAVIRAAQVRFEYANAMHVLLGLNRLPDGSEAMPTDWGGHMANNSFSIFDVDGDGEDELLIRIEDTYMAGMRLMIYSLGEHGQLLEELGVFPAAEYYEKGFLRAYASHNHSYGTLWPYTLFGYDPATGVYEQLAQVYGWDRHQAETDYSGNPFPHEADADGNGSVVCIQDAQGSRWIDDAALHAWEAEQLDGAKELQIPWQFISEANVSAIWP